MLAKFGLGAEHVLRPPASLSPGERTRATLAVLQARGVNLLSARRLLTPNYLRTTRTADGEELGIAAGGHPDAKLLAEICAQAGEPPDVAVPAFAW